MGGNECTDSATHIELSELLDQIRQVMIQTGDNQTRRTHTDASDRSNTADGQAGAKVLIVQRKQMINTPKQRTLGRGGRNERSAA